MRDSPDAAVARSPWALPYRLAWLAPLAAVIGMIVVRLFPLDPHASPDSWAFEAVARSLLAGHGFTYREPMLAGLDLYAFRAPAYSVFAAVGLALGGVGSIIALQGALNGLSAALVGRIAGQLVGPRAAWMAFALRLIWPAAWFHARMETSETLFECLGVLGVWMVLESVERRRHGWSLLAGIACAAALLTRPVGLANLAALALWLLLRSPRFVLPFVLTTLLIWAPWPVRNYLRLHAFVPFSTLGGATSWAGTQEDGQVGPAFVWMSQHVELGEVGLDRHFYALSRANVRAQPLAALKRALNGALIYLGPLRGRNPWLAVHRFTLVGALVALLIAAARRRLALPALLWAAQGILLLPVIIIERYRFPTEWCVVVACAAGWAGLGDRLGPRRTAAIAAAVMAIVLAGTWALARP